MSSPELDWTFSDAPQPDSPRDGGAPSPKAPASKNNHRPPRGPRLSRRQRRLIVALAAVAALTGVGLWLFTQLGLRRLQTQLAAQIAYEDQRAQAGDVAAVLALQASGDAAWRDDQAARVRLGLAAPLPAGDLLPAGTPPRLVHLEPLGGDLFAATVSRDYVDGAGKTYTFDLAQRYRNVSAGAWERLPPDLSALSGPPGQAAVTPFEGQRLSVTVPTADLPWLGPALLQADDLIVKACADWGDACPAGQRLVASFGVAKEFSEPTVTVREKGVQSGTGVQLNALTAPGVQLNAPTTPRIFYLTTGASPGRLLGYTLPTPLLAGRPHDAAAQAALNSSIGVQLLADFAGEVTSSQFGATRAENDYFLDALVAREEVRRLGASAAPQPLRPQDFVPIQDLWWAVGAPTLVGGWRTDLAARREAFDFLNYVLQGQPATVDGKLLLNRRDWLAALEPMALGDSATKRTAAWTQQALDYFAKHAAADWTPYAGLVMACNDGLYQVQAGAPRLVTWNMGTPEERVSLGSISPDRRYADIVYYSTIGPANAVANSVPGPWTIVVALDLKTGVYHWVFEAPEVRTFGWSATGELLYGVPGQPNQTGLPAARLLMAYQPSSGGSYRIIPDWIDPYAVGPAAWSADHSALLLGLVDDGPPGGPSQTSLAVLTFTPTVQLHRLGQAGYAAALSPDGQRVAFVEGSPGWVAATNGPPSGTPSGGATLDAGLTRLSVLDRASGHVATLAATNDLGLPVGTTSFWDPRWSADGRQLAWRTYPFYEGDYLLTAPAAGGPPRVWAGAAQRDLLLDNFSPDGRYLAARVSQDLPTLDQYWLLDQQAKGAQPPLTGWANSTVWARDGHRLVIAGAAGVSALDPASGEWEWLGPWQGCQLRW